MIKSTIHRLRSLHSVRNIDKWTICSTVRWDLHKIFQSAVLPTALLRINRWQLDSPHTRVMKRKAFLCHGFIKFLWNFRVCYTNIHNNQRKYLDLSAWYTAWLKTDCMLQWQTKRKKYGFGIVMSRKMLEKRQINSSTSYNNGSENTVKSLI